MLYLNACPCGKQFTIPVSTRCQKSNKAIISQMMSFVKPLQLLNLQCVNCTRNKFHVTSHHMTSHFTRRSFSSSSYLCKKRAARERAQKAREETVFQHAGKDPKRADRVYGWGFAQTGALGVRRFMRPEKGYKQRHTQFIPHKLEFFDMLQHKVVNIGCGYGFTVFVCRPKEEQSKYIIYGTGINTDSQIGYHEYPHKSGRILDQLIEPAQIHLPFENPDRAQVHSVSCGRAHTVIHTSEAVFSLGNNVHGQCGRRIVEGETFGKSQTINKVNIDPHQIKQIECGQDHTLFVMESGEVFACGLSSDGQTGQGHYKAVDTVTKVTGDIEGERIVQVSSKADTVLAVSDKGDVFGWGNSEYSQLSIVAPDESQVNTSRHLPFTQVGKVTKVTAGGSLCAVVNNAGDVYVWGYGILGKGPNVDSAEFPTRIPPTLFGRNEFNTETKVKDIQAGLTHLMAVNSEGELFAWGKNRVGTLGLAHNKDQFFPFKVMVPAETQRVFCGIDHTVVMAKAFV